MKSYIMYITYVTLKRTYIEYIEKRGGKKLDNKQHKIVYSAH